MITFENLVLDADSPIYLQIIRYIKWGIVAGTIKNQDELPSRRVLSAVLGVNPNTVQKAYRLLEEEHIIQSHSGAKSYVVVDERQVAQIQAQLLEGEIKSLIHAMQQMGISKQEALSLLDKLWD